MQAAARSNLKSVCLELGGKSPLIVFADADLESAAELATTSITYSMSLSRLLLVDFSLIHLKTPVKCAPPLLVYMYRKER